MTLNTVEHWSVAIFFRVLTVWQWLITRATGGLIWIPSCSRNTLMYWSTFRWRQSLENSKSWNLGSADVGSKCAFVHMISACSLTTESLNAMNGISCPCLIPNGTHSSCSDSSTGLAATKGISDTRCKRPSSTTFGREKRCCNKTADFWEVFFVRCVSASWATW